MEVSSDVGNDEKSWWVSSDWMAHLEDSLPLRDVKALPGTHNSGTAFCCQRAPGFHRLAWPWARCQSATIEEQLRFGVRWFDLRWQSKATISQKSCGCIEGGSGGIIQEIWVMLDLA